MSSRQYIAIDGPVASGKTSVGRLLAKRLGYRFLDTGVMYRAVTWAALQRGVALNDEISLSRLTHDLDIRLVRFEGVDRLTVDGQDIVDHLRAQAVERGVSLVASIQSVRSELVTQQRHIAGDGAIVMVGRDIASVVLHHADVKVFLMASVEARALRRYQEFRTSGSPIKYEEVVDDLVRRDKIDSERVDSPMHAAEDAVQIYTDELEIEEVVQEVLSIVEAQWL